VEILTGAARPILDRWFESEELKGNAGDRRDHRSDGEAPSMPGTAYVLFHHVMGEAGGTRGVWAYMRGRDGRGSRRHSPLPRARPRRRHPLRGRGGPHSRAPTGGVAGVALVSGDEFHAPIVASNADAKM